jgi:hypothetical protein
MVKKKKKEFKYSTKARQPACQVLGFPARIVNRHQHIFSKKKIYIRKKKKNTAGHALRHNMEIGVKNGMDG